MSTGLMGATGAVIEYALDGLSLRHSAIAANIANSGSAGYRPIKVSFEEQLARHLSQSGAGGFTAENIPAPTVRSLAAIPAEARRGALETQVVELNGNVLQYQSLVRGLDKYLSVLSNAINEGKR